MTVQKVYKNQKLVLWKNTQNRQTSCKALKEKKIGEISRVRNKRKSTTDAVENSEDIFRLQWC